MGYWLGLDCSSAAIPAFNLSPLTSQHGSPLTNKDHQCRYCSKQQHYPCLANRGTLSRRGIWTIGEGVLLVSNISSSTITFVFALTVAIHRIVVAWHRRLKWLIHSGLVRVVVHLRISRSVRRLLHTSILRRVGGLIAIALSRGKDLCRKRHGAYKKQNAYHNDMQRTVKEAINNGKMIVFVSHDCKNIQQ